MPDRSMAELIVDIDTLNTNLKARLGDVPHLSPMQAELEAWIAEVRALEAQQEIFTARLRETNEKRRLAEARGAELLSQAANALRGHFGSKSKVLHEFGVRPRGRRRSSGKTQEEQKEQAKSSPAVEKEQQTKTSAAGS